jgi:hypothetical protein
LYDLLSATDGQALRREHFVEANASLYETLGAVDLAATIEPGERY